MIATSFLLAAVLQGSSATSPPAISEDLSQPEKVIGALYDVISGPAGQKRNWERFKSLFAPNGSLTAIAKNGKGEFVAVAMTPDEYISRSGPYLESKGFFEKEVNRQMQVSNSIAMAWSEYESRSLPDDPKPFQAGTNAIQMYSNGKRWFIVSVLWQAK